MPRESLHPDVQLGVTLSGLIAHHKYTTTPDAVVAELLEVAGGRVDVLAKEAGTWVGFHESDEHTQPLADALRLLPGVGPWVRVGQRRLDIRDTGRC